MNLMESKILAMCLLGGISLLIGLLVWKLKRVLGIGRIDSRRGQTVTTSLLLCFGGGVLFATAMLHILPEVKESMQDECDRLGVEWLAELTLCAGFFLVYLVEEGVHLALHFTSHTEPIHRAFATRKSGADHETANEQCNGEDCANRDRSKDVTASEKMKELPSTEKARNEEGCCQAGSECHNDMELREPDMDPQKQYNVFLCRTSDDSNNSRYNPKYEVRLSLSTATMFPNYHPPDSVDISTPGLQKKRKTSFKKPTASAVVQGHSHVHAPSADTLIKDFITVLALSFHAVFEGLAVGLEERQEDVWTLFAAIATHKFVITFCVSLELLQSATKGWLFMMYLVTFSLVTPLGIGIGILISELDATSPDHLLLTAVLQGLAAGTILYVVMFEVLQREKSKEVMGALQLLAILIGFCALLSIELLAGHSHEHEGHRSEHFYHGHKFGDDLYGPGHEHEEEEILNVHLGRTNFTEIVPLEDHGHDSAGHRHQNPTFSVYSLLRNGSRSTSLV